jgi:hypothetical protein
MCTQVDEYVVGRYGIGVRTTHAPVALTS